jgi:hypothetical protein
VNAPQGSEAKDSGNGSSQHGLNLGGKRQAQQSYDQEHRPDALAEVVLAFYNDGVKNPDDDKGCPADQNTLEIHGSYANLHTSLLGQTDLPNGAMFSPQM